MADLFVAALSLGRWQANCYVVGDRASRRAVLVDPGETAATRVPPLLAELDVEVEAIWATHGHVDHVWAVPELAEALDVPVLLHPGDRWLFDDPGAGFGLPAEQSAALLEAQFGLRWSPPTQRLVDLADGQRLDLAGHRATVTHTPGHTPGSVTFWLHDMVGAEVVLAVGRDQEAPADVLLSGDLVFAGSIGRTDFPRGSDAEMAASLRGHLPALPDDTLVLSGHGPDTTVGHELATNLFVRRALATARQP
jgi:hydroxyacylglutathione hydrolase